MSLTTTWHDTRLPFDAGSAWSSFSLETVAGNTPFETAGTDGRFVYFLPRDISDPATGVIARHDLMAPLDDLSSWRTFKTTQVNPLAKDFWRASWDGRFFYFMVDNDQGGARLVVRHNTTGDFESATSWSSLDMTPLLPPSTQTPRFGRGVVFDGEYVYIAGVKPPIVMRFHARTPSKMPPGFSGTF